MNETQAAINETELFCSLEDMATRLKGLARAGIITKAFAQDTWQLHVRSLRRSYIYAENEGMKAMDTITSALKHEIDDMDEFTQELKNSYTQLI
jgi:predicted transcriptional regulator